jgi:hypothetical protein
MRHTEYLKAIKQVVGKYCNNKFQPKPNTNIVIGLAESSRQLRHAKIEKITEELKTLKMFKNIKIQNSINLGRKSNTAEKVRRSSGAKIVVIDAGLPLPYVVLLKPANAGEQKLGPGDFKLTGKVQTLDDYIESVAYNVSTRKDIPEDMTIFLDNLLSDVIEGEFQRSGNKFVKKASKDTQIFFNDSSFTFYQNLNKQFGEVLAPFILRYDDDLKNHKKIKISFPNSAITSGKDFSVELSGNTFNYSVKTGATLYTNTVKPSDILRLIGTKPVPKNLQKEYAIIKKLDKKSAEMGVELIARYLGYKADKKNLKEADKKSLLDEAIKYIETESKKLDFRGLLAFSVKDQLTFIKFTYTKQHNIMFEIIKSEQIGNLQKSDSKIYLRGKGVDKDGKMNDKLGLTPP